MYNAKYNLGDLRDEERNGGKSVSDDFLRKKVTEQEIAHSYCTERIEMEGCAKLEKISLREKSNK